MGRVHILLLTFPRFNGSAMMLDGLAEELAWGRCLVLAILARLNASGGLVGLNM